MSTHATPAEACSGSALGLLFRQTRDAMWSRMARELADAGHELTFSQYIAIKKLAIGTASVTDLARAADLNPGAMTRVLDQLEAKGLLRRVADPDDRRALRIELDASAQALMPEIRRCGERVLAHAQQGLTPAEQTEFRRLLERIRDNLSDAPQG